MLHYLEQPLAQALAARPASRRSFIKGAAGLGAGLVIGAAFVRVGVNNAAAATGAGDGFMPFVRIAPDSTVTVIVKHLDKGQGAATGLATLVADELDASWAQTRTEFAPADTATYKNLLFGVQGTGGSTAMANSFDQYRQAGATARAMLIAAAAETWKLPASEISIADGNVSHPSGKSASFGELAELAASLPVPQNAPLKTPEQWVYIGKLFPRVDTEMKSQGAVGAYGLDVALDDMLIAVVARPPRWGAKLKAFDATAAKAVRGVIDVRPAPTGVVVFATATWPAIKGRDALEIEWDFSEAENRGSDELLAEYRTLADQPGPVALANGDAAQGLAGAAKTVEATYSFPYLSHAPMEPLNVTVHLEGDRASFWTGSQIQTLDQNIAAAVLGLEPQQVSITTTWAGGSFGRRAVYNSEYVAEAALIAKVWGKPQPIQVVWTREDDIKGGYYRPMYVHKVEAGVDAAGNIAGWRHRIVGQSIFTGTSLEKYVVHDGIDHSSVEGVADTTYAIPNAQVELHSPKVAVPTLWWRAVGHTHTAYVMETMMDELAHAAGRDPVAFRLDLLADDPRKAGVLKLAAEKAGWDQPLAAGRHRGVAVHKSFNSYVAEVAEITLREDGTVKVEKVTCAVDCGVPINPDNIRSQVEGDIGYGLGAILRNAVTLSDGEVEEANFDTYEPIRIDDMPEIEVHIVASREKPTGIGEPGTPPIGPAVANAVFAATGKRARDLPFSLDDLA